MLIASREQMKKLDELLLERYTIEELVDKASDCLLEEVRSFDDFCIICGGGNNGADGYSLALKLHHLNKKVWVFACQGVHVSTACRFYYQKCLDEGLIEKNQDDFFAKMEKCHLIIDALFGFGCHYNPQGLYGDMIQKMNALHKNIISIDVPSGMDCTSGEVFQNCVRASKTITFFAYKLGFFHPDAVKNIGEVIIKRLHVEDCLMDRLSLCESIDRVAFKKKSYDGHKGSYGKSFLICGSEKYHGAALLSTKACVYTGCGITCLCSDEKVLSEASLYVPEAIHVPRMQIEIMKDYQAALIGCGLENGEDLLKYVLHHTHMPLVIDASALNDLAHHLDWLEKQERPVVLTPHLGEFKRLCPDMEDPSICAIEFAKKHHVILVLKGPHTLITDGTHSYRNMSGNGAMACPGNGDVLAGIITSLLAQGYSPLDGVCRGVFLHGAIGDELAMKAHTALPSKMVEEIPSMMKKMEEI